MNADPTRTATAARGALLALALALTATAPAFAQDAAAPTISAAQYAPASLRQDIVRGAYELLDAPDLGLLFVAAAPSFDDGVPGYVYMLNRDDLSLVRRIQLPRRAFALAMDHKAGRLYVGNTVDGSLTVIDAKSGLQTGEIQLGKKLEDGFEHTRMIEVDQDSGRVFVTSPTEKGGFWIVDGATGTVAQRIDEVATWAAGLAHDPVSGKVYVGGGGQAEIAVIDGATGKRLTSFSTGDTTSAVPDESKHFFVNLTLDAAGKRLFAADADTNSVYVFDTESGKVIKTVPVGPGTLDVIYNPARDEVYATYRGASRDAPNGTGGLVVIDAKDYTLRPNLSLPSNPNSLSVSPDGALLFVSIKAPRDEKHPDYRVESSDSVLRLDLARLQDLPA